MAGGKETPKEEKQEEPSVRRGSKSIWPWKKETDGSASFLRAARAGNLEKVLEFLKTNTDINTCNANGLNALHLASKEGHTNVVSALLERSANVDSATKKGNTALHIASLAGQDEIVKVLVEHGATVNIQSQNGFTPLYMAAQENHDSVVRFLLSHGANQSLATEDGFTPLAVALQQGHDRVVSVLLENDTRGKVRLPALHIAAKKDDAKAAALLLHTDHNPDITSKSGFTPLHIASHYGNDNIAGLLIQRGADVNYVAKHQITPLHVASKWGKGNMVSLLLDKGANIEAKTRDGLTPLHCAARSGHETVVDMLLEKGAPITAKTKNGLAPLHMASQGDHVDAARILLYHKAPVDDVTVDFLTALHVAAHCGHVRVAKLLLDRKADPNSRALNGFTPLHIACKKNRIKVVELLLKHGASIEATTESGLTPLHVASFMGCMNIVIYLIQHGASADVPTVRGESPLHLAARANQTDIIRILLRNGAEVDAKAREQQTALHIASRLGNTDIVGLLLQQGASVDAPTKDLYTPLHIAAKEGQDEVAGVLLDHGASLNTATKKGFTPLHLAAKYGHLKVARLLLQRDAPVDPKGKNGVTPLHVAAHYDNQNVAMLLLDKGAQPHATAKNGYTPLHIAARKNQMDIAGTLLEYGANANAESKAGFTPLHLSAQEGHTDMATLLLEHGAQPGGAAKNGLTPLHLCAQEDRVPVGAILVKHGAAVDAQTKAGYTPLHVAAHFGQMNMVRFLLQHGTKVDAPTQLGYTPLHQAAQQGHTQIVNLLLENKAQPNMETNDGKTALSIAQRLGYISVVETLKIVTETRVVTNTTTTTEEKYKVVVPETMHETFMSESEDEGADDTMLGDQSYRYLTVDEMKSLGDDSLPIDVTRDEKMDVSFQSNLGTAPGDHISPLHKKELYAQNYPTDNIDVGRAPILAGPESLNTTMNTSFNPPEDDSRVVNDESCAEVPDQGTTQSSQFPATVTQKGTHGEEVITNIWDQFLVSFMVDARGGAMRGCRHSGVRVIIPPRKAAMPMRITCRYLKKDKLVHAPPLMEGEALGSRILEMGPSGAKFLGPVIIEVPHFASLRGKEREIVILRSDNGETWREHTLEATEEAVQEVLNESFDGEELKQLEDLNTNRITRILTTDFPQYFAIVTRIRQEVHAIGPEGGMVSSTVVPQVQAVFPQGALTKKIKVGLQAQPISTDLVAKLLGNRVAVSPIVTVEPRRRKFHKPITLTIPVPQAASKGMINQYSGEAPTLRLLCSITGGTTRAQWEDVTGSTPLTFVNDCVSFTTTVSARFWLMDCTNIPEATKMATELYREAIHVPFMAKFVVFSKRHQLEEARVRVFCMTDDKEDKTLESQEHFIEVAKSRDVEVLEGKSQYLEFAGNLIPVTKSGDQLAFNFYAFRENRLPFTVRVKDQNAEPVGRVAFMRQPKVGRGDAPQSPICNLNLSLPDNIQPEPAPSEPDLLALEKKYAFLSISKAETIHKADLRLTDISNMLTGDWVALAKELEISDSDINIIKSQYPDNTPQQAVVMLRLWMQTAGNKATGNTLEKALRSIHREDIVDECICNVEVVTDVSEKATAEEVLIKEAPKGVEETIIIKRSPSPETYEEKDLMKDAESADEDELAHKIIPESQREKDLSPTYETEERKYAAEEKIVKEIEDILQKEKKLPKDDKFPPKDDKFPPKEENFSPKEEKKLPKDDKKPPKEDKKPPKEDKKPPKEDKKGPKEDKRYVKEEFISQKEKIISEIKTEETIKTKGNEIEIEKREESMKETKEEKKEEKMERTHEKKTIEKKEEEKETIEGKKVEERQHFSKIPKPSAKHHTTTSEDEVVSEHITSEKRTSAATVVPKQPKEEFLQKLGEELGKLDEKLEEKFKEKNKKFSDGFTQPSAETSQMVQGDSAPSDVKPPATAADQPTTDLQPKEKETGERASSEDGSKKEDCGLDGGKPTEQDGKGKSKLNLFSEHESKAIPLVSSTDVLPPDSSLHTASNNNFNSLTTSAVKTSKSLALYSDEKYESKTYSKVKFHSEISHIEAEDNVQEYLQHFNPNESSVSKTSPSPSSVPSLSTCAGPTDDSVPQSFTQNSFSVGFSIGPISPTEDSNEDHAEIDRTSTEISADSVRLDQDILDTKTEDEAPDIDDDLLGISPAEGHPNYRPQSFEATEDTDITTPLEMRDSQERDSTNSLLESSDDLLKEKDISKDFDQQCNQDDGDDLFKYASNDHSDSKENYSEPRSSHSREFEPDLIQEDDLDDYESLPMGESFLKNVEAIKKKIDLLQERIESEEIDPDMARTEALMIHSTVKTMQETFVNLSNNNSEGISQDEILGSISNMSEAVNNVFTKIDIERKTVSTKRPAIRTESTIVETGSSENDSPLEENEKVPSLSDLLDLEDINRETLDEEFEVLAAQVNDSLKTVPNSSVIVSTHTIPSSPSSESVFSHVSTQQQPDVGVVFTEPKESGGGEKLPSEKRGGQIFPQSTPLSHTSSSPTLQSHDDSRPQRRHERTYSQASNIISTTIPDNNLAQVTETEPSVEDSIKPYSERKQFWETVTSQSFETKSPVTKSETESDTDTGTDGTVIEKSMEKASSLVEPSDSEYDSSQKRDDSVYENVKFREKREQEKDVTVSQNLPSPEDISLKDVKTKKEMFEKEIKRQSSELEESLGWKRSSKDEDDSSSSSPQSGAFVTEKITFSSDMSSVMEKQFEKKISEQKSDTDVLHSIEKTEKEKMLKSEISKEEKEKHEKTVEKGEKIVTEKEVLTKEDKDKKVTDDLEKASFKSLEEKEDGSVVKTKIKETSTAHTSHEQLEGKSETVVVDYDKENGQTSRQTSSSTSTVNFKESISSNLITSETKFGVKSALGVAPQLSSSDSTNGSFERSDSTKGSSEKSASASETPSSLSKKQSTLTSSADEHELSEFPEDSSRTDQSSEEESNKIVEKKVEEERRKFGDTEELLVREITTTREGDQEQRVIKETKTQETLMPDGSTVKTTSVTTFTTQLDRNDSEDTVDQSEESASSITEKEKSEVLLKQIKADMLSEAMHIPSDEVSPEHKLLSPDHSQTFKSTTEPAKPVASPIHVPEESVQDIVWEVSQEQSDVAVSETVQYLPDEGLPSRPPKVKFDDEEPKEKIVLNEDEARNIAREIVEEVKIEALKRSPVSDKEVIINRVEIEQRIFLPKASSASAFTSETSSKLEKYIQEQLGDESFDEKHLSLLESVAAKKTELLKKRLGTDEVQLSLEITDEDLKSSGAELSPIEIHMERLRQMTEEEELTKSGREPSEADESESSMIIHETIEEAFTSGYDQANQMFNKTLDNVKSVSLKGERAIDTICEEMEETEKSDAVHFEKCDYIEVRKKSREELTEAAVEIVKEITVKAKESELLKQLSSEHVKDECDSSLKDSRKSLREDLLKHDKSLEVLMESSMTESVEECSAAESTRAYDSKFVTEMSKSSIQEVADNGCDKKPSEKLSSPPEEIRLRKKKKSHIDEFNRRSGTDFDAYSSSGESHYFTAAEGTDSRSVSRPCSSDVEALLSGTPGSSEYDTALTSQDGSQYSRVSSSSREFSTAPSDISSRDSMKSIDSESSGNLGSIELSSEASETLVPSALDLEKDMEILDRDILEEELMRSEGKMQDIPQLTIQSETPREEDIPSPFDTETDDTEYDTKDQEDIPHVSSKMKRSMEMTFHPEPKILKENQDEFIQTGLEESTISDLSVTTVVERDRNILESSTSDTNMTSSNISEQNVYVETKDASTEHLPSTEDEIYSVSGIDTRAVTITSSCVPRSHPDEHTASICTQVTSDIRSESKDSFFRTNGPTEIEYVSHEGDTVVTEGLPVIPTSSSKREHIGATGGHSVGPESSYLESYEPEADQEYGQMIREGEDTDLLEEEIQRAIDSQPEDEIETEYLKQSDPVERPKTPEPGSVSKLRINTSQDSEELTEVDKRFSAIFSVTYEEPASPATLIVKETNGNVPDITITEHMAPIDDQYRYPDLECDDEFPECRANGTETTSHSSSVTSPKSSTTDSEHGREYCLDSQTEGPVHFSDYGSFEVLEAGDIADMIEYEDTILFHEKRLRDLTIKEEDEVSSQDSKKEESPILPPAVIKAVKLDTESPCSSGDGDLIRDIEDPSYNSSIEEQRRWLEMQFEENNRKTIDFEYPQQSFVEHIYSGPLEDIEEERDEYERRDLSHITKTPSLSSTPEYDVLAGRKFFTRSGEQDDVSVSSLQEFEHFEREVAIEQATRRSSSGSQESLNGKRPGSGNKSVPGDDISVSSFSSLNEFERLEKECMLVEQIETKVKTEEKILSEIEEGHESQVSESESCETISDPGRESPDNYDKIFEIEEIIRQAQTNVEKFEKDGVLLKDIVGLSCSTDDRTPSVEPQDSLEEAIPTSKKEQVTSSQKRSDVMVTSIDSLESKHSKDILVTSTDSLEDKRKSEVMSASADSIETDRRDLMATSADSLGRDDSSGREGDISSESERVGHAQGGIMDWSTDSLEPTSSQATHATYQYETDSVMSGSFTSGCSTTLMPSIDDISDVMSTSMYLPEGELPDDSVFGASGGSRYEWTKMRPEGIITEVIEESSEPEFSQTVTRTVTLPPDVKQVTFTGPDAKQKLEQYVEQFNTGEHSTETETVDSAGNVHVQKIVQKRLVIDPNYAEQEGIVLSEPKVEESFVKDEHGNVTRVVRRTVISTHTVEIDLDTGEPIIRRESSLPESTNIHSSSTTHSTTVPHTQYSHPSGPPSGSHSPREPLPTSLEPNTASGNDVEPSTTLESYGELIDNAGDDDDEVEPSLTTIIDTSSSLTVTTTTTTSVDPTGGVKTTVVTTRSKEEWGQEEEEEESEMSEISGDETIIKTIETK